MSSWRATVFFLFIISSVLPSSPARAQVVTQEWLCDSSVEDCRTTLIQLIRAETTAIDLAFWFMEDSRYTTELIARWRAGVPVRVLVDEKANTGYPLNATMIQSLKDAGIPIRRINTRYMHWKFMLFAGQNVVQFGSANYSPHAFVPQQPLVDFIDETIYYTNDPPVVQSFMRKFDDAWLSSDFRDLANVPPLARSYPLYSIDPNMNFPPSQDFGSRSVGRYNAEVAGTGAIDSMMYRITDSRHTDALIAAHQRGVPVRIIVEQREYRVAARALHSYNVDRLIAAGIPVRQRKHQGWNHEKLSLLHGQKLAIFGSQNWSHTAGQYEHNYFTKKAWIYQFFKDQFERKWNSTTETEPFVILPPDAPVYAAPASGAAVSASQVTLRWNGGLWAHNYDIYFGTTPNPPLVAADLPLGNSTSTTDYKSYTVTGLSQDVTYYWRVVGKTMANMTQSGPVWNFRTGSPPAGSPGDVVLWASRAQTVHGKWTLTTDSTAAGGARLGTPNDGVRVSAALANPADYFEMSFTAEAGVPYRLWLRGKAVSNSWGNDSAFVQFDDSVTSSGAPTWRIGTTSYTTVTIEDCTSCGLSAWGWNDNLTNDNAGALGPLVYFETTGTHTVRVQMREDGLSLDQIVLSRQAFLNTPPGTTKNDGTILPEQGGTIGPPPPGPGASEIVLWAANAPVVVGAWQVVNDTTAAGGKRMQNPNAGAARVDPAMASPASYFELTFNADAGRPYRLWMRSKATGDNYNNDSVWGQFDGAVTSSGTPIFRIGTTSATRLALQEADNLPLSGWGWEDDAFNGDSVPIYFHQSGTQRIRIQVREDGLGIDQIVLSAATYLHGSPGLPRNDTTILTETGTASTPPPPPPPPATLPSGWQSGDIGAVGTAGSATFSNGTYTVKGAGADVWDTVDAFHYAYRTLAGDGTITARVASLSGTQSWTKIGVMIRNGTAANAAHAFMVVSKSKGLAFQYRPADGGTSLSIAGGTGTAPKWVRLTRAGNVITAYVSNDGTTWTTVGSDTFTMANDVLVGLAAHSHTTSALATGTFDNVTVVP